MKQFAGVLVVPVLMLVVAAPAKSAVHQRPATVAKRQPDPRSAEVAKAQADLTQVEKRLRGEFEQGDDYVKADGAVKQAQGEYDAAVKAAVEKIKDKPEYKAALETQGKVEDEVATARLTPGAKPDPDLAARLMDARTAVRKLEMDAGDADPAAKDAQGKVKAAKEAVAGLRAKFDETMRSNPDWIAAKKTLDDARGKKA